MNANDNMIWQALGMGPQWHLKTAPAEGQTPDSGVLMVGDFDLSIATRAPMPEGQAGILLLNMLATIDCSPEQLTFVSLRPGPQHVPDLKNLLQQTPFSHVVLMGDESVQALFGSHSNVETHHSAVHELDFSQYKVQIVVMPSLTDLIAKPALKGRAWEALCLIRARFLLQH